MKINRTKKFLIVLIGMLLGGIVFSVIQFIEASPGTPNPGHPASEIGPGTLTGTFTINGDLQRGGHSKGYFIGSYNNIGANSAKSNPIYVIGSNYKPGDATIGNMYGVGYSHDNFWYDILGEGESDTGWGFYVAADGNIRATISGSNGDIWSARNIHANGNMEATNVYATDVYASSWLRNDGVNEGLYNSATASHFYSSDVNYWVMDSNRGMECRDGYEGPLQGYLYWDDSGNFGLLSPDASWGLRLSNSAAQIYHPLTLDSNLTVSGTISEAGTLLSGKYLGISAKAADSNFLDSIDSPSFLRSDANDSFTGQLTMSTQKALIASNYGHGVYGVYSPTRYQHVWSMGTAYNLPANGLDESGAAGNLYGLAWSYNPNYSYAGSNPQAKAGLNHQLLLMMNGTTYTALGNGIWTNGNLTVVGNATVGGQNVCRQDGTNCPSYTGDNLGNHTATQNIRLNGYWLSGDGGNEGVFVKSDGNVGIGETSPPKELHIKRNDIGTLHLDTNTMLILENAGGAYLHILTSNTDKSGIRFGDTDWGAQGGITYDHSIDYLHLRAGGSDRVDISGSGDVYMDGDLAVYGGNVKIGSDGEFYDGGTNLIRTPDSLVVDGKVGIGDTTPDADLKLDVEGKVGATEYCDQNGANCTAAADLGGGFYYPTDIKKTTANHNGDFRNIGDAGSNGYRGMYNWIQTNGCAGYHVCTANEMVLASQMGVISLGLGWISTGVYAKNGSTYTDCNGWTTNSNTIAGVIWSGNPSSATCGIGWLPVTCCK